MTTRGCEMLLTVSFLTILFAVPAAQTALEWAQGERPQALDLVMQAPTERNLRAFESDLEESSWVAQVARPLLRRLHFAALRDPGDKVLLGRNGWLFYKPGVDYLVRSNAEGPSPDQGLDSAIAAIVDFRDQLQGRGIELMVVPVPGKASVYPDRLTYRAAEKGASLRPPSLDAIHKLRERGVATIDLFTVFRDSREAADRQANKALYLAHDSHWSPPGVRRAAEAIADQVRQFEWMVDDTVYQRETVEIRRVGDILRMMQLPGLQRFYTAENILCQQIARKNDSLLYGDENRSPVLLLGDSYSRIYQTDEPGSAGLIAQLAYELKMPLSSLVNDGGASTLVRQQLVRRPELLRDKKLVIWQFAERDIRFGTEGWKPVPIPGGIDEI